MKTWKTAALILLLCATACGKSITPEAQIRARISAAAAAAEKKEHATLRAMVSDKYSDAQGQDKRAVEGMLRIYFLRNESLHLFTRTRSVEFPEKDKATAVVYVAMAAQPVSNAQELERLRADLYRFEMTFVKEEKEWRVARADWRPAELGDFVH
jgi:hypothetical protein